MIIDEKAFEAFMLAYHEYGGTGLGFRKCLQAYEDAKQSNKHTAPDTHICDLMRAMDGTCFRCGDKRTQNRDKA